MSASRRAVLAALAAGALAGCGRAAPDRRPAPTGTGPPQPSRVASPAMATAPPATVALTRAEVVARYGRLAPHSWGFGGPGVVRGLPTTRRVIALTFDACGGRGGSGYDEALITFLRRREVPGTLFLNSRWIDEHPAVFRQLRREPLFELANHGTRPRFFRAGTAYSDDVAARIVAAMGDRLVTFSVNGDGGATFTPDQVRSTVAAAPGGSLVLAHMNHPEGGTARGVAAAVPRLTAAGYRFVRLSDELPAEELPS
jgi:peptidoglycan/xylan/chitin deacetylase (PgdA/CDA1 family)